MLPPKIQAERGGVCTRGFNFIGVRVSGGVSGAGVGSEGGGGGRERAEDGWSAGSQAQRESWQKERARGGGGVARTGVRVGGKNNERQGTGKYSTR